MENYGIFFSMSELFVEDIYGGEMPSRDLDVVKLLVTASHLEAGLLTGWLVEACGSGETKASSYLYAKNDEDLQRQLKKVSNELQKCSVGNTTYQLTLMAIEQPEGVSLLVENLRSKARFLEEPEL